MIVVAPPPVLEPIVMFVVDPLTPPVPMFMALVVAESVAPVAKLYVLAPVDAVNMFTVCAAVAVLPKLYVVAALNSVTVVAAFAKLRVVAAPNNATVPFGVANALVNPVVPSILVSPAKVVDDPPNETAVEPNVTELLANMEFDTVPVSPVPTSVPVVIGSDNVGVPAVAVACSVAVPLVLPGNATELIPVNARLAVARLMATLVVPI